MLVLAEEEIVAIDLQSENWPTFRQPYLASLHSSAITTAHHVNNVPDTLWNKIVDAGDSQMANQSTRVCVMLTFEIDYKPYRDVGKLLILAVLLLSMPVLRHGGLICITFCHSACELIKIQTRK